MGNFLDQLKEKAPIQNPCTGTLSFQALKGVFKFFDPLLEGDERKIILKETKVPLVILGYAKQFRKIQTARGKTPAMNVSTNLFQDYDNDKLYLYENGVLTAEGNYYTIRDEINRTGAKVVDVYFGIDVDRKRAIMIELNGGKIRTVRNAFKKVGGFQANPFITLYKGKKMTSEDFNDYYELGVETYPSEEIPEEIIEIINEVGPKLYDYFDHMRTQASRPGLGDDVLADDTVPEKFIESEEADVDEEFGIEI